MKTWLAAAYVGATFNMLDAILTMRGMEHGYLTESNPIMGLLLGFSIPLFYLFKATVSALFVGLGIKSYEFPIAKVGLFVGLLVYCSLLLWHLLGLLLESLQCRTINC